MDNRQSDKLSLSFSSGGLKSTSKSDMLKKTIKEQYILLGILLGDVIGSESESTCSKLVTECSESESACSKLVTE